MKELVEIVGFIKDHMMTKDDGIEMKEELMREIEDTRLELRGKVDGLHRRLDDELDKRLQIDVRLTRVEKKVGV